MKDDSLIARLQTIAHDPTASNNMWKNATEDGKPVQAVANPPLSQEELVKAEKQFGFGLPSLLRRMYLEVGNGGKYGPGYGFMTIDFEDLSDVQNVLLFAEVFERLDRNFPICYWGCEIFSVLDIEEGRVGIANGIVEAPEIVWQKDSLEAWLWAWLDGENLG